MVLLYLFTGRSLFRIAGIHLLQRFGVRDAGNGNPVEQLEVFHTLHCAISEKPGRIHKQITQLQQAFLHVGHICALRSLLQCGGWGA